MNKDYKLLKDIWTAKAWTIVRWWRNTFAVEDNWAMRFFNLEYSLKEGHIEELTKD